MQTRYLFGAGIAAVTASLVLAGCSGSASPGSTPGLTAGAAVSLKIHSLHSKLLMGDLVRHGKHKSGVAHSWFKAGPPPNPWLYIADAQANVVNVYSANGSGQTPIAQITGFNTPQSLWVDVNQNLWVANTGSGQILGFHRGQGTPFKTFNDPTGYPAGVCGNNNQNLLFSLDIQSNGSGAANTINVYKKNGGSDPIASFTDPNAERLFLCAVDKHGNLFVGLGQVNYPYMGEVDEFPKNSETPTVIATGFVYPLGITVDKYNALAIVDTFAYGEGSNDARVYIYDPPYTNGPAYDFSADSGLVQTALNKQQTQIWGANAFDLQGQQFSYPAGILQNTTSSEGLEEPEGAALTPPANGK